MLINQQEKRMCFEAPRMDCGSDMNTCIPEKGWKIGFVKDHQTTNEQAAAIELLHVDVENKDATDWTTIARFEISRAWKFNHWMFARLKSSPSPSVAWLLRMRIPYS